MYKRQQLAKREPALAVGLHVNISWGGPLTSCPSLLKNGMFQKPAVLGSDEGYDVGELDEELEAQYQCFVTLVGRGPTHIDSHLYAHQKFSKVRDCCFSKRMRKLFIKNEKSV